MDGGIRPEKIFEETMHGNIIHVMIQLPDGRQFVVLDRHFGKKAKMRILERKPDAAAMRVMKTLDTKVRKSDFEIQNPRGLGPKNCFFVVWFPSKDMFDGCEALWHDNILPVEKLYGLSLGKKRAIESITAKARKIHMERMKS